MSDIAINVEGLSKRYVLGSAERASNFREAFSNAVKSPLNRIKRMTAGGGGDQEFWALRDVNFEVKQGEVVGVIGRNGAGKSTLLKILSRITPPTSGRIRLRGRLASLLEVGTGFHPELTGRENIYMNGVMLGMTKAEVRSKFDEIVAFSEIEKFLDTPVKRYSSGMYVRLAFAVAAHLEPEILIVDEVLAVGDAQFQKKCIGKMKDVSRGSGRTVLFVSHNMQAIDQLCTSAIVLKRGGVHLVGSTRDAIASYEEEAAELDMAQGDKLETPYAIVEDFQIKCITGGPPRTLEPCVVTATVTAKVATNFAFGLYLGDSTTMNLAYLDSKDFQMSKPFLVGQKQTVKIDIDRLPLFPGPFFMRFVIRDDVDWKNYAMTARSPFPVIGSPGYGSARPEHSVMGVLALKADFSVA